MLQSAYADLLCNRHDSFFVCTMLLMMAKKIQDCFWQSVIIWLVDAHSKNQKSKLKLFSSERTGGESMVEWIKEIKIVTKLIPNEKKKKCECITYLQSESKQMAEWKIKLNEQNLVCFFSLREKSHSQCAVCVYLFSRIRCFVCVGICWFYIPSCYLSLCKLHVLKYKWYNKCIKDSNQKP